MNNSINPSTNLPPLISWEEGGETRTARWRSESGMSAPKRVMIADDTITADTAYRLACEGTAMLWRGDFQNARQLLQAMARRISKKPRKTNKKAVAKTENKSPAFAFHLHRQAQSQRARVLGMLLLPFESDYRIPLRRAPNVQLACSEVYGASEEPFVISFRELLGLISAHEWRKNGLLVSVLGERIHPHYGVFAPIREEYIDLLAKTPLPTKLTSLAFDIGTGTGVLSLMLARRGVKHIIATDQDPRALTCARENMVRLGLSQQIEVIQADLFPPGQAPLIICNPPWVPARPSSPIEFAVYDPENRMLRGFLNGLAAHLTVDGEGWLILSDLAEHLGLRTRAELQTMIDTAGLKVLGRLDVKATHPKATDGTDLLHAARAAEVTSLWRLAKN